MWGERARRSVDEPPAICYMCTCRPTESQSNNTAAIRDVQRFLDMLQHQVNATSHTVLGTCNDDEALRLIGVGLKKITRDPVTAVTLSRFSGKFSVKHYAKQVEYDMARFCEKSKDQLDAFVVDTLRESTSDFVKVRCIWGHNLQRALVRYVCALLGRSVRRCRVVHELQALLPTDTTSSADTLGVKFVKDVEGLIVALDAVEQHYVRCVKSNVDTDAVKRKWKFDARTCYTQLTYV